MGAGILPTTIHNNKLYFLFGKENKYEDYASGFSDFGGGTNNKESFLQTAIREGSEELTGFLGTPKHISSLLKKYGYYTIDYNSEGFSTYRCHIFPYPYDEMLPYYYNNNQQFLQKNLDPKVFKETTIFEKSEIKWVCVDDLLKMKKQFRSFYQNIIEKIYQEKSNIYEFMQKPKKEKYFIFKSPSKTRKNRLDS